MRLHLVNDEKIINRTISVFEDVFPGENLFVVANKKSSFKWVKKRENVLSRSEFSQLKKKFTFSEVYIHLLNQRKMDIIHTLSLQGVTVYWIIWGLDLYNKLLARKGFSMFAPSNSYYKSHHRSLKCPWNCLKEWSQGKNAHRTIEFIKKRVDYIVTDTTENDYYYLLKYYPELKSKPWKDFFYYPLDVILGAGLIKGVVTGNNIMIGNSASATNNHEYVMKILSQLNVHNRQIVVPLSYSGKKKYIKSVIQTGENLFGDNFNPLLDFMPLTEYNKLQTTISVALFGNWRQEAIGNIIVALYLGAKVFLPSVNPVYEWAQNHGLVVYELEKISQQDIDTPLDDAIRENNKSILSSLYTKERMYQLIKEMSDRG